MGLFWLGIKRIIASKALSVQKTNLLCPLLAREEIQNIYIREEIQNKGNKFKTSVTVVNSNGPNVCIKRQRMEDRISKKPNYQYLQEIYRKHRFRKTKRMEKRSNKQLVTESTCININTKNF